jgi:1-acyl-sn-glycerol-3-phosphate acyltransferase
MAGGSDPTGKPTAGTVATAGDATPDAGGAGTVAAKAAGSTAPGERRSDGLLVFRLSNAFARFVLWMLRTRVILEGTEHIPDAPGVIVATNHLSIMDPVLITIAIQRLNHRRIRYMAKAEAMSWPVFGRWLVAYGGFPVRRGQPDREAYRRARGVLVEGDWLGLAPEGGRTRVGHMIEPKPGVALLAVRTGALVLPAGIWGSEKLWAIGARFPRPFTTVTIRFGEPYPMSEFAAAAASREREAAHAPDGSVPAGDGTPREGDVPPGDGEATAAGNGTPGDGEATAGVERAAGRARKRSSVDAASEDLMHRIARLIPQEYRGRFG